MPTYPKSRLGRKYVKKADLLRELDTLLTAVENGEAPVSSWAVTDWYLDGVSGSDNNDGLTSATPLKTGLELLKRIGPRAQWSQPVTFHVLPGGLSDGLNIFGDTLSANARVDVVGTPTLIASATVSAYTAMDHTTPQSPTLTCTGITDWTPYVGRRVRITSGNNAGSTTWVLRANPHSLGNQVARTGVWYRKTDLVPGATHVTAAPPAVGDTVVIESLPTVTEIQLNIGGVINTEAGAPAWAKRQYSIDSIDCPTICAQGNGDQRVYRTVIYGCRIDSALSPNAPAIVGGFNKLDRVACLCLRPDATNGHIVSSHLGCCFMTYAMVTAGSGTTLQNCVSQGVSLSLLNADVTLSGVQIFDIPNATRSAISVQKGSLTNVSGSDNLGYGLGIYNRATLSISGTLNLRGTVSFVSLQSTPLVNLTSAQFVNPCSDFASSGTVTLVGGTATVAVPYVDWAAQRLTFSLRASGGTPGTVSVPTASRTATGFTITSSSAADTSSYDWAITPLGRQIFVGA